MRSEGKVVEEEDDAAVDESVLPSARLLSQVTRWES